MHLSWKMRQCTNSNNSYGYFIIRKKCNISVSIGWLIEKQDIFTVPSISSRMGQHPQARKSLRVCDDKGLRNQGIGKTWIVRYQPDRPLSTSGDVLIPHYVNLCMRDQPLTVCEASELGYEYRMSERECARGIVEKRRPKSNSGRSRTPWHWQARKKSFRLFHGQLGMSSITLSEALSSTTSNYSTTAASLTDEMAK
jgi:hypothetical protein